MVVSSSRSYARCAMITLWAGAPFSCRLSSTFFFLARLGDTEFRTCILHFGHLSLAGSIRALQRRQLLDVILAMQKEFAFSLAALSESGKCPAGRLVIQEHGIADTLEIAGLESCCHGLEPGIARY